MTQPRRGLGRGLDALFGGAATAPPPQREAPPAPPVVETPPVPAPQYVAPPAPIVEPPAPVLAPEVHPESADAAPVASMPTAPAAEPDARYEPPPRPGEAPASAIMPVAAPVYSAPPPPPPLDPVVRPRAAVADPPAPAARGVGSNEVDIDLISPNPEQPRTNFEPEKLRELSHSIMEHGIIQPLVVSRDPDGGFRLIAGERRLQAARLAGLNTVPVVIRDAVDAELLELALIENIQRADLNAIEEAMAYRRLTEEYGLTQEEAARRVGKSRVTVANALRLLQLEPEIRRSLIAGEITEGHARALLGLSDNKGRMNAWREVVKRALSVRDTEGLVRRALNSEPATQNTAGAATARRDAGMADIESRLRNALSTRVSVVPQRRGARITIDCFSAEEFEHVIEYILGDEDER